MKVSLIFSALIALITDHAFCSPTHQNISDCHYNASNSGKGGGGRLTLMCLENSYQDFFIVGPKHCTDRHEFVPNDVGEMNFTNCELTEIAIKFFEIYSNVHALDISELGLQFLRSNSFIGAKKLKILNAGKNKITEIPANLFA